MSLGRNLRVIGAIACVLGMLTISPIWPKREKPVWSTRQVHYALAIRNKGSSVVKESELVAFSPIREGSHQRVTKLKVSESYDELTDALGNRALRFKITVPPYGTKIISFDVAVQTTPIAEARSLADRDTYLREEKYIEYSSPSVQAIVDELQSAEKPVDAEAIYNLVVSHLTRTGYTRDDKGADFAAREKKGDCTEYSYLFVALARAYGIPARVVGGFVIPRGDKIRTQLYHNWAEFYEDGAWQIADTHAGAFKKNQDEYIAFRIIGSDEKTPLSGSERFLAFDPNLEVTLE